MVTTTFSGSIQKPVPPPAPPLPDLSNSEMSVIGSTNGLNSIGNTVGNRGGLVIVDIDNSGPTSSAFAALEANAGNGSGNGAGINKGTLIFLPNEKSPSATTQPPAQPVREVQDPADFPCPSNDDEPTYIAAAEPVRQPSSQQQSTSPLNINIGTGNGNAGNGINAGNGKRNVLTINNPLARGWNSIVPPFLAVPEVLHLPLIQLTGNGGTGSSVFNNGRQGIVHHRT